MSNRAQRIANTIRAKARRAKVQSWKRHSDRDDLREALRLAAAKADLAGANG